ncbi:unnamed protein product [Mytilus edulis]|uniref:Reverse transcriptase domain-containing protein n=1 Tax=Mytilus edulis TaxID=6550 RepID=A0A8S3UN87_MYTED|nr:unnamed protein product [Mytilus edulis]
MVVALLGPTRQVQCRVPCLEATHQMLLEVSLFRPVESGDEQEELLAENPKPKLKEQPVINIMHWNAEGASNKRDKLQHFLHENNVNICCIQETHLQEGKSFKVRGYQVFRSDRKERKKGEHQLILVNDPTDTPTFYSRRWHTTTTPDLAFCTDDIHPNISRKVCDQLGGSDHRPVILSIRGTKTPIDAQLPRWNYKKANWGKFETRANELTKDIVTEGKNINNVVKIFNTSIVRAAKESIPRGVRKDYKPYWSNEIQETHDALTRAREEAESNPSQENNIKLQQSKAKHLKTKLECQRRGWREKTSSLNMEKDTTKLWNLTKALNDEGSKGQKITLEDEGKTITGKAAANAFAKGNKEVSNTNIPTSRKKEIRTEIRERQKTPAHEIMQTDITMSEMKQSIRKLKKKKSPGPDNITNEMLQHLGNSSLNTLLDIFNLSWRQGQVPQCWKEAIMMPILKKGKNKSKASSYRPISLTSSCCKLQYKSTEDQTTHLSQVVEDAFQSKKVTLVVFVDLQRAFDKVWKDGLLAKMLRYGISGRMYKWTKSYLYNRRARVLVDGQCGQKVLLKQGVPQGGVLPPTLFILFMNYLVPDLPKGVQSPLYADDLVLWCSEEYTSTAKYRIQTALDMIVTWAKQWCVTINREKT